MLRHLTAAGILIAAVALGGSAADAKGHGGAHLTMAPNAHVAGSHPTGRKSIPIVPLIVGPVTATTTSLGKRFASVGGFTLYTFSKDPKDKSICNGGCAKEWPPYLAARGAKPFTGLPFTIITRHDGRRQWAFLGKPLYFFDEDENPGDANGNGEDGFFFAGRHHILGSP